LDLRGLVRLPEDQPILTDRSQRAADIFEDADVNRDGQLSLIELEKYMREHPEICSKLKLVQGWNQFFEELDKDWSGFVDRQEFEAYYRDLTPPEYVDLVSPKHT